MTITSNYTELRRAGWRTGRFNIAVNVDDLAPRVPRDGWINATKTFGLHKGAIESPVLGIVEMARLTHLPSGRTFGDFESVDAAAIAADLADEVVADIEDEDLSYILTAWTYWVERGFVCFCDEKDLLLFYRPPCRRLLRLAFEYAIATRRACDRSIRENVDDLFDRFLGLLIGLDEAVILATLEEAFANVEAERTKRKIIETVAGWNGMTLADYDAKLRFVPAGDTRLAMRRARRWLDQLILRDPSGPPAVPDGDGDGR